MIIHLSEPLRLIVVGNVCWHLNKNEFNRIDMQYTFIYSFIHIHY